MPRAKIDVQQIDWAEQINENVSISGSLTMTGSLLIDNLGTESSVLYVGDSGEIASTNTLYIDEVNNRVGMNTSTPQEQFHVHGNNATIRVGNGTNSGEHSPKIQFSEAADANGDMIYGYSVGYNGSTNNFELKRYANSETGNIVLTADRGFGFVGLQTESPEANLHVYAGNSNQTFSNVSGIAIENAGSSDTFFVFQTATAGAGKSFSITNGGKVGIGTTTPSTELDVDGDVTVSGQITATTQPAFLARKPSNNQDSFAVGSGVDVTLSTEDFDVGSNFASNTFTAPTTGVYIFTANVYLTDLDTDANYYALDLVTTAGTYRLAAVDPGGFSNDITQYILNGSIPLLLTAGDTAKIQVYQSGGTQQTSIRGAGTRGTFFAGYLLG